MERTSSFTKIVDAAQKREDELGRIESEESASINGDVVLNNSADSTSVSRPSLRNRLFPTRSFFSGKSDLKAASKSKDEDFVSQVRSLSTSITTLKDFLESNRNEYLSRSVSLLNSNSTAWSEIDRDQIDHEAEQLIKLCNRLLSDLQESLNRIRAPKETTLDQFDLWLNDFSPDNSRKELALNEKLEHQKLVLKMLELYLKCVCDIYSEQKAVRLKSSVERKKLMRLEASTGATKSKLNASQIRNDISIQNSDYDPSKDLLSNEEFQQLELENAQLFNDLQDMDDQVKVIEGQVVEISRLQSIFTEKVLSQSEKIESVHMTTVGSTENIKEGNEHIRSAMRNNAGLRFWILFFLVVSSFSLLFLDWYDT